METGVIVAIIGGITSVCCSVLTLLGVIVANNKTSKKQGEKVNEYKNLTIYRIDQLEKKQDRYNNIQERLAKQEGYTKELRKEMESIREHLLDQKAKD